MNHSVTDTKVIERWLIECPDRCTARGCTSNHGGTGWRVSKELNGSLTYPVAKDLFDSYTAKYRASGPYRLVKYVFTTTTDRTVHCYTEEEATDA